jgi:hypothetical protein
MHTCPQLRYLAVTPEAATASRSLTSGKTITGALPPSSSDSLVTVREAPSIRILPTRTEPVNWILRSRLSSSIAWPMPFGSPLMTLITPAGTPASVRAAP